MSDVRRKRTTALENCTASGASSPPGCVRSGFAPAERFIWSKARERDAHVSNERRAQVSGKSRALVIDDSSATRMILKEILAERGWDAVEAADGLEAAAGRPTKVLL